MALLTLHNIGQSFGAFDLFAGISAGIEAGSRIGLVGPNGIGKTSLLLILAGLVEPASGSVSLGAGVRLGYLRQEAMQAFDLAERTVYAEMMTVFDGVKEIEARLRHLEECMAEGDTSDALLTDYGDLQEQFELRDGYTFEVSIKQTLEGLGFAPQHWTLPLKHLSGGQKTRALLARLLLEKPDLLILDEPTNHLDMEAVEWLENRLRTWEGALLIVSHDRYFLDRAVNMIWEMSRSGIEAYRGNYSAYLHQRQDRWERSLQVWDEEMERLYAELDYVKRNIARASTNPQAVGRLRKLSRDIVAIRSVGVTAFRDAKNWTALANQLDVNKVRPFTVAEAEREIKALQPPFTRPPRLSLRLETKLRSGDLVIQGRKLHVGYPTVTLFAADDFALYRGDRAALIGGNGTGKTTLLRTIMGELAPLKGAVTLGMNLKVGYFAQAHEDLLPDNTVIDELIRHKEMPISQARSWLAHYMFRKEDVYKRVGDLSGGERARLAMAILGMHGANFLLLDEPTNHLDIQAQEALQEVLDQFEGTVLLVTHDRYLVDHLATQIWTLEDGRLHVFKGDYQAYLVAREQERLAAKNGTRRAASAPARPDPRLAQLERQIGEVEATLTMLDEVLQAASRAQKVAEVRQLSEEYQHTQQRLETLMADWAALAEVVV